MAMPSVIRDMAFQGAERSMGESQVLEKREFEVTFIAAYQQQPLPPVTAQPRRAADDATLLSHWESRCR